MFYLPEGKASFFGITGGEPEMVHCEVGTTAIIPGLMRCARFSPAA